MKPLKILAGVSGAFTLLIGAILIAVAIGFTTWIGRGDMVAFPQVTVETNDGYVIFDEVDIMGETPDGFRWVDEFGSATISVRSQSGESVFIGIAATDSISSAIRAGDLPAQIWTASDYGPSATVEWDVATGPWSLVVAGPDAQPLNMVIDAEFPAAPLRAAAGFVGTVGVAFAAFGGLLLWVGLRRETPSDPPAQTTSVPATA
jgi:hypothetical protein